MNLPGSQRKISPSAAALALALAVVALFLVQFLASADGNKGDPGRQGEATLQSDLKTVPEENSNPDPTGNVNTPQASAGKKAPAFTVQGTDGPIRLSEYAGRPVVLEFIATWCEHCRASAPAFAQVFSRSGVPLLQIGAARESLQVVRSWHNGFLPKPMPGRFAVDPDQQVVRQYGVTATPTTVFVDKGGNIKRVEVGELSVAELRRYLAELS